MEKIATRKLTLEEMALVSFYSDEDGIVEKQTMLEALEKGQIVDIVINEYDEIWAKFEGRTIGGDEYELIEKHNIKFKQKKEEKMKLLIDEIGKTITVYCDGNIVNKKACENKEKGNYWVLIDNDPTFYRGAQCDKCVQGTREYFEEIVRGKI